jgi:murein endopeptidase
MRLKPKQLEMIHGFRRDAHEANDGCLSVCDMVSLDIEKFLGFKMVVGHCRHDSSLDFHCWNVMPDGTILDATADQFGLKAIQLIGKKHKWRGHYRRSSVLTREIRG